MLLKQNSLKCAGADGANDKDAAIAGKEGNGAIGAVVKESTAGAGRGQLGIEFTKPAPTNVASMKSWFSQQNASMI